MRRLTLDKNIFKTRRSELAKLMPGAVLVIPSHPEQIRNYDVHYDYRQDSSLFYLTGFEEPESCLVFRPGQSPETVLFVRPKDASRETWDGFRFGPALTESEFGVDKAFLISDLDKELPELLKFADKIYYRMFSNPEFDGHIQQALQAVRSSRGRSGMGLLPIYDSGELLGELRVRKTGAEIEWLKKACDITAQAHINAMRFTRPGVTERQIQGVLMYSFLTENSVRVGYNPIVATGNNAVTLHYVFNDQPCQDGDMILIDAGTEFNYHTGDITRTFPVNGRFTSAQRKLYEAVLSVQKDLVAMVRPGLLYKDLQDTTVSRLTDIMLEFGLLKGDKTDIITNLKYKKYYPHGVSHFLGMDVHDAGLYMVKGESRPLEPGMALTIEPGLYVPQDDTSAPAEFRGIGIRIEDDILVTEDGNINMTARAPKEISEMESIIGTGFKI